MPSAILPISSLQMSMNSWRSNSCRLFLCFLSTVSSMFMPFLSRQKGKRTSYPSILLERAIMSMSE